MALDTYSNLKTEIASYLNRDDLTSNIDTFIDLAESRHAKDLRLREMAVNSTDTTVSGTKYISLPTGFLEFIAIQNTSASPQTELQYMAPNELNRVYVDSGNSLPVYYTIIGDKAYFGPTPDNAYTINMYYYKRVTGLSDSNTTNDILTNYPELYLYGSLLEATPFIQNDERLPVWANMYNEAIQKANLSDEKGKHSSSPMQMTSTQFAPKRRVYR